MNIHSVLHVHLFSISHVHSTGLYSDRIQKCVSSVLMLWNPSCIGPLHSLLTTMFSVWPIPCRTQRLSQACVIAL